MVVVDRQPSCQPAIERSFDKANEKRMRPGGP
jgi:hypothetical protein